MERIKIPGSEYISPKFTNYEKKPFVSYFLFLLILIPLFIPDQEDFQLYDKMVNLAFVTTIITIIISFWMICKGREKEEENKINVMTKKGRSYIRGKYQQQKIKYDLDATDRNLIVGKIKELTGTTKEDIEKITTYQIEEDEVKLRKGASKIMSVLFGLVAALAITNALDIFMDENTIFNLPIDLRGEEKKFEITDSLYEIGLLVISQEFILLASFFVIGAFFYHCGLAFFSDQAADMLNENRPHHEIILSGILLFTDGIFLYFAANSIGSILQFSLWIFFLMIVDIAWVFLNSIYLKKDYAHWIHFDLIMLIFLLTIILSFGSAQITPMYHHYLMVFSVIVCRIIVDYKLSWKFFGKFEIIT
jgi:hypothetical protein